MHIFIALLLLVGTFYSLAASIGVLRFPDLYTRMHAITKAGTVGIGFLLLAVALFFCDITVTSRAIGILFFIVLTAPVAAHLLGKAMLNKGYKAWTNINKQAKL